MTSLEAISKALKKELQKYSMGVLPFEGAIKREYNNL